ncbi:MAG: hypothetical protein CMJ31_09925 [Phycisphaerae bacterium]|nr:hypothetical protein [Phycisphaerae bacterium]
MKGVVFTEFLGMVERAHGLDMVDELIETTSPASGGVYVSTGTYDHAELAAMVVELSKRTGTPVPDLLHAFGKTLFGRFVESFPNFFEGKTSSFDFLRTVDTYIHVEVRKLYPDAELPRFTCDEQSDGSMEMVYQSSRHLEDLAHGLIEASIEHFGDEAKVVRRLGDDGSVIFGLHPRIVA